MERQLRRYQDILVASGTGVIFFGVWNLLKVIMYSLWAPEQLNNEFINEGLDSSLFNVALIVLFAFGIITCLIRLYVGRRAIKEAKNEKKGRLYIALAVLYMALSVFAIVYYIIELDINDLFTGIMTIVVEGTSLVASTELVVSAIKVKTLSKKLAKGVA